MTAVLEDINVYRVINVERNFIYPCQSTNLDDHLGSYEGGNIILDLSEVDQFNSSDIGSLITLQRQARETDSKTVICGVKSRHLDNMLNRLGIYKLFECYDSVEKALER